MKDGQHKNCYPHHKVCRGINELPVDPEYAKVQIYVLTSLWHCNDFTKQPMYRQPIKYSVHLQYHKSCITVTLKKTINWFSRPIIP